MAKDVRARMVKGAMQLIARKGLGGTSFADVIELTGAPRGSVYHHFPGGKSQLVKEAVTLANERALEALGDSTSESALEVTNRFLDMWRELLARSSFTAGCSVLAVTIAAETPDLLEHAAGVFRLWRSELGARFRHAGLPREIADATALLLISASEGSVVLSRAQRSMEPFNTVADQLVAHVRRLESDDAHAG